MGAAIILCVVLHVGGLFLTSPPGTLDALLLVAPTPFSVHGVLAMWSLLLTGVLAATMATLFDLRIIRPLLFWRRPSRGPAGDYASSED